MDYTEFDHKLRHKKKIREFFTDPSYGNHFQYLLFMLYLTLHLDQQVYTGDSTSASNYSDAREIRKVDLWTLSSVYLHY